MNLSNSVKSILLKISAFAFSFYCFPVFLPAEKADSLFLSDEIINIELKSDFSAIQKDRTGEAVYHDGELIYQSLDGKPVKLSVKVMARGHFRRDPVHCNFPPLFLNFKKNEVRNTIFENQNKIKLVTHCQTEEDLIEEYTIYKMYNQVTDLSMKVRLVKILYFDTSHDKRLFEKYSFFIEDKERVAERNDAFDTNRFLTPFDLDGDNFKKLSFFQYMIGNRDWFITSRKNIDIMQPGDTTKAPCAVPYDFDFAGLINASYTKPADVPDEYLSNRRVYKGLCYTDKEMQDIFKFYRGLRPAFESIISNQKLIAQYRRKQILKYLDYFSGVINSKDLIKQEFLDKCETRKDYNLPDK
jgi:hypothetical protein